MMSKLTKVSVATLLALGAVSTTMAASHVKVNHGNMNGQSINDVMQLTADYSFKTDKSFATVNGTSKQRASMFYQGVPVYGQSVVLEQDAAGRNLALQGSLAIDIAADLGSVTPGMLHGQALGKLKKLLGHNNIENSKADLVIYIDNNCTTGIPRGIFGQRQCSAKPSNGFCSRQYR